MTMGYETEKSQNKMDYCKLKKTAVILGLITVSLCSIMAWWNHEMRTGYIRNDGKEEVITEVRQQGNIIGGGRVNKGEEHQRGISTSSHRTIAGSYITRWYYFEFS